MEINDQTLGHLRSLVAAAGSGDASTRKGAEAELAASEVTPGFSLLLLKFVEIEDDMGLKQMAAVLFKNFVANHWEIEDDENKIPVEDRSTIKQHVVELMCSMPPAIQKQLSEAVNLISQQDFPEQWPELLPQLVEKLSVEDFNVINGVLETALAIFNRFIGQNESNEVNAVLKVCLDNFQEPLLHFMERMSSVIDAHAGDGATLTTAIETLTLLSKIFYALNYVTIPAYFSDNMGGFFGIFHKYLTYDNPLLHDDDEFQAGPLEVLRTHILENVNLYAEKYDEDFVDFFATFAEDIWNLLSKITGATQPKYDRLVITATTFLTNVCTKHMHREMFSGDGVLDSVCTNVVVPSLYARENEEDLFEENHLEYIRQDMEGSDSGTRRRAAINLVRTLNLNFSDPFVGICVAHVERMMQQYATNPAENWRDKDAAINLMQAAATKSYTMATGVTVVNPGVNVEEFLVSQVLPELQADDLHALPMVKATCIKFVTQFRPQFSAENLMSLLELFARYLQSPIQVLHTYAAMAVELMIASKHQVVGPDGKSVSAHRLSKEQVAMVAGPCGEHALNVMVSPEYKENKYMMKMVMRLVQLSKELIVPHAETFLNQLTTILARIYQNPTSPLFNHFLFDTLAVLVRNVCTADPASVDQFETLLFPVFQAIMQAENTDFLPYIFQLMTGLLHLRPDGALSDNYKGLLDALMAPELWKEEGNMKGLTALLQAYIAKDPQFLVANNKIEPILKLHKRLLAKKRSDAQAFHIVQSLVQHVPLETMRHFFNPLIGGLMTKLSSVQAIRLLREMFIFMGILGGVHGGQALVASFDCVQPGLLLQVLPQLAPANLNKVLGKRNRKIVQIGFIRLLTEASFETPEAIAAWVALMSALVAMIESAEDHSIAEDEEGDVDQDEEMVVSTNKFSKLAFAVPRKPDPFADVRDVRKQLGDSLKAAIGSNAQLGEAVQACEEPVPSALQSYMA